MNETAHEVATRLDGHEGVCAERYNNILHRLGRMENVIWTTAGVIIFAFFGLVVALIADRMKIAPLLPSEPPSIAAPNHR